MLIRVADGVLGDAFWHPLLDVLAALVEHAENPHSFDPIDYRRLVNSRWLSGAVGVRSLIAATIAASAKSVAQQGVQSIITVEVNATASTAGEVVGNIIRIHPYGALFLLTQPFSVIVEDETSDGGFILWAARALGSDAIRRAYRSGSLTFRHAGGKGQLSKSASALSHGIWPRADRPIRSMSLRAAVVLDSDAKHPQDVPNKAIRDGVLPFVAFAHILAKRTIENYVPIAFLMRRLGNGERARINALFRMTDAQRAHFPMKRGYRGPEGEALTLTQFKAMPGTDPLEASLYTGATEADWNAISSGFGDGVSAVYTDTRYRCEFNSPNLFNQVDATELNGLLKRLLQYL